ncbi:type II secretion system protein F [Georgenia yuyongxinii]|uniref:Type II secretion system protein F n=1 Tax=Georgenia yuyongxinii TaxID=2589797 RepID=A0A5B8C6L5_9MICO|nr:type II secretion system F family protein [Georgenia yuyongxinii]QDC25770.1 type II secretion system protein F [Georgenia yuyongxinii]
MSVAVVAAGCCAAAVFLTAYLLLAPRPRRLARARRRPGVAPGPGLLTGAAEQATGAVERMIRRRGGRVPALERAGVRMRPQDLAVLVVVAALVTGAAGLALGGPLLGLVLAAAAPVAVKVWLARRAEKRRRAFADQLDDSLQLLAGSLRAGHSLQQALASVAREAEEPTSEEFARVINETRVGRDLGEALNETAARMGSQDFVWVTQAIAINREVGGNLAEVLDGVAHTVRERHQIRRQIKALAAEGKLSAIVLMLLPVGIVGFLSLTSRSYLAAFTQSPLGYALMVLGAVLLLVGGVWMRKVVSFTF